MKMSARLLTLTLALIVVPAVPAMAATTTPVTTTAAPVIVAQYTFDAGATATGRVAENSGRGLPLTVRSAGGGAVRFAPRGAGRYVSFPARCAAGATGKACPRALLEAASDADLNPGTRPFRWGATVFLTPAQLAGSSNVMQKGVTSTDSQWKMQIGSTHGKAHCVVVGLGSAQAYIARSTVPIADGKWHQVLCRRSGTVLAVDVDGVNRGQAVVPATLNITNAKRLRIGGPNFNTASDMFHGALDDVYAALD
jgi:Concanavalin A-like lectin/glucanases superfamily